MADENTTGSEPATTETPASATPSTAEPSATSSTTPPSPEQQAQPDAEPAPGTILTETPAADPSSPEDDSDGEGGEDETSNDPAAQFHGAPEGDYELVGLPEDVTIDKDMLSAIAPVAKELNLSNEGLSKLALAYNEQLPRVVEGVQSEIERQVVATHAQWADEARKLVAEDPVFEGKPLTEVQQVAAKALDRFFGPEAREYLAQSGLGNYPPMVKGMYLVGTTIAEDTTFERGGAAPAPKSRTDKFYGSQT